MPVYSAGAYVLHSDDHGASWQMGGVAEVRPPVAPRRPKSAYFIFADAERAEVKRALPDLAKSVTGMSKELAAYDAESYYIRTGEPRPPQLYHN